MDTLRGSSIRPLTLELGTKVNRDHMVLTIAELAAEFGVASDTLRYYVF